MHYKYFCAITTFVTFTALGQAAQACVYENGSPNFPVEHAITSYRAEMNEWDKVNSKKRVLKTLNAWLQQDRANYHRFKKRSPQDEYDDYFTTPQKRSLLGNAKIVTTCGHTLDHIETRIRQPQAMPTRLDIQFFKGPGHNNYIVSVQHIH